MSDLKANSFFRSGDIDKDYGEDGICRLHTDGFFQSMAEGKNGYQNYYYVAGFTGYRRYFLARITADGKVDSTFGSGGIIGEFTPGLSAQVFSVAVQKDGKVLVSGTENSTSAALARFNMDGTPDISFGVNGVKVLDYIQDQHVDQKPSTTESEARYAGATGQSNMVLLPDGKILLAHSNKVEKRHQLIRLEANGNLDLSFQGTGFAEITVPEPWRMFQVTGLGIQKTGEYERVVVCGCCNRTNEEQTDLFNAGFFKRFYLDGNEDTTFNGSGLLLAEKKNVEIWGLTIQSDGMILGVGRTRPPGFPPVPSDAPSEGVIVRLNENGALDMEKYYPKSFELEWYSGSVQKDGKIVVAGIWYREPGGTDGVVGRFHENGDADPVFGSGLDGVVRFPYRGRGERLAMQDKDFILVGGTIYDGTDSYAAVLRFRT
ncbi:hypothetical protein [Pseudomonas sp. ACN8]|uniref:hypothetical protein n=1 Tax=unclassified Pseudomonas TaxID=196821 RepID=UPI0015522D3F|nr:hypothetical protein [Pseudomonas sp. ACN8]PBJ27268.1 hypothetical protein BSF44_06320 [Pseudomonas sp. ACN8]